jgi:hypothetical protein
VFYSDSRNHSKAASSNAGWVFHQLLGDCLGLLNGNEWKLARKLFEPEYTSRTVHSQLDFIITEARRCVDSIKSHNPQLKFDPSIALRKYPFWCTAVLTYGHLTKSERQSLWDLAQERNKIFGNILRGGSYCLSIGQWLHPGLRWSLHSFTRKWRGFNKRVAISRETSAPSSAIVRIWQNMSSNVRNEKLVGAFV